MPDATMDTNGGSYPMVHFRMIGLSNIALSIIISCLEMNRPWNLTRTAAGEVFSLRV
jgi:hypothetical protein